MDWMRYDLVVDTLRALEEALQVFYYPGQSEVQQEAVRFGTGNGGLERGAVSEVRR